MNSMSILQGDCAAGFEPVWMPDFLFDFQKALVEWGLLKGRAAFFAGCGLGKTLMQLTWAENIVRRHNANVLILAPLAVSSQTVREGFRFGFEVHNSRNGKTTSRITTTNYEKLHLFDASKFDAVVCDESGILKNAHGSTRNAVIEFLRGKKYVLLCSATPSPNDYTELGNSCEALSVCRRVEMLARYFVHDSSDTGNWRLKGHATDAFWKFVASWARAIRHPRDLGFEQEGFDLPELRTHLHVLKSKPLDGMLFPTEAITLDDQRMERRETIEDRCATVAQIANSDPSQFLAWCSLNSESERLAEYIKDSVELQGSDTDDEKEEKIIAFSDGKIKSLIAKPQMCSHGINWQGCHRMSFFPSHSHEQYYQAVRRCWRFMQTKPVDVHIVTTESEATVLQNLQRKEREADLMFSRIVENMSQFYQGDKETYQPKTPMEIPAWLM